MALVPHRVNNLLTRVAKHLIRRARGSVQKMAATKTTRARKRNGQAFSPQFLLRATLGNGAYTAKGKATKRTENTEDDFKQAQKCVETLFCNCLAGVKGPQMRLRAVRLYLPSTRAWCSEDMLVMAPIHVGVVSTI